MSREHLNAGGVGQTLRRYRCRRGHETDTKVTYSYGRRCVAFCQHCYLDLIERECGGVAEVAGEPPRKPDVVKTVEQLHAEGGRFYRMGGQAWCDTPLESYRLEPGRGYVLVRADEPKPGHVAEGV